MDETYESHYRLHLEIGKQAYNLHVFGDHISKREGYQIHRGMDAIHFYLIQKHNWLPSVVRSMNTEDLYFCVMEEMKGWTLPEAACPNK